MRLLKVIAAVVAFAFSVGASLNGAAAKSVEITINKVSQKMTVRVDGDIEHVWPVSTGAAGYETPGGSYKPFRLEEEHFSKEWDDAPMPYSIFFTDRGHAIHGSYHVKSLGRRASHGCVRLEPSNAAILFDIVQSAGLGNTKVNVRGGFLDLGSSPRPKGTLFGSKADPKKKSKSIFAVSSAKPPKKALKVAKKDGAKPKYLFANTAKKPVKKIAAKKATEKKVAINKPAQKCVTKGGKKTCRKAFTLFGGAEG